jgi:hypothetical protein
MTDVALNTRDDELARDFAEYHARFAAVFDLYCTVTIAFIETGINGRTVTRLSPQLPLNVIRATSREGDQGANRFRINNNFGRFYRDLFCARYPQHAWVFASRSRPSKRKPAVNRPALTPSDFAGDAP